MWSCLWTWISNHNRSKHRSGWIQSNRSRVPSSGNLGWRRLADLHSLLRWKRFKSGWRGARELLVYIRTILMCVSRMCSYFIFQVSRYCDWFSIYNSAEIRFITRKIETDFCKASATLLNDQASVFHFFPREESKPVLSDSRAIMCCFQKVSMRRCLLSSCLSRCVLGGGDSLRSDWRVHVCQNETKTVV